MTVIDTHLHLWDLDAVEIPWLTPALGPLHRSFGPAEAEAELRAAGVDAAVLVQAADSLDETRWLLRTAEANPWIAGVVGWVALDDRTAAVAALDGELAGETRLRGIRHLVHDDPRDEFFELPEVRASLVELGRRGLVLDVPDAWPRHLAGATAAARATPELTVVIDHLGKPPLGRAGLDGWRTALAEAAALPNTAAKFSGLHLPGTVLDIALASGLLEVALELFGADRVMYGGDWPMSVPHGGYAPTFAAMRAAIDRLSTDEAAAVLGGTATRVYGLHDVPSLRTAS
ncbi:amidohydrolase family protein [Agromyces mediolanus]|uniref:amidohydrolase family protein n=1 Tax=Agromyces mediolanus TaxID=41986 RepID=UPI00203A44FD|nr:amidohydrolase family protein [Agromyces mediolanus]MCM3656315.1 amidohydrolase family protein [Agromyces mediolanus]